MPPRRRRVFDSSPFLTKGAGGLVGAAFPVQPGSNHIANGRKLDDACMALGELPMQLTNPGRGDVPDERPPPPPPKKTVSVKQEKVVTVKRESSSIDGQKTTAFVVKPKKRVEQPVVVRAPPPPPVKVSKTTVVTQSVSKTKLDQYEKGRALDTVLFCDITALGHSVRRHMVSVYVLLSISILIAAAVEVVIGRSKLVNMVVHLSVVSLILLALLLVTGRFYQQHTPVRVGVRTLLLFLFAACTGGSASGMIQDVSRYSSVYVGSACLLTIFIFVTITLYTMVTDQRRVVFYGPVLTLCLVLTFVATIVNTFVKSTALYVIHVHFSLGLACVFVLYDTQVLIHKAANDVQDKVLHALELFIDFFMLFRHILMSMQNVRRGDM